MGPELLQDVFVEETSPLAAAVEERLLALERTADSLADEWSAVLSLLHTIKGNCGMMRYEAMERLVHAMEDRAKRAKALSQGEQAWSIGALLGALDAVTSSLEDATSSTVGAALEALRAGGEPASRAAREAAATAAVAQARASADRPGTDDRLDADVGDAGRRLRYVRLGADKLDRLLEAAGELSTHHTHAVLAVHRLAQRLSASDAETVAGIDAIDQLGKHVHQLRTRVMEARLLPLSLVLGRFERMVRDLARAAGKRVGLRIEGADTVVDKSIVDLLGEPLVHILRNAVDHGIEPPAARRAAGKPEGAVIWLRAEQSDGSLVVVVGDDGRGISREGIEERARGLGIDTSGWSREDVIDLIFAPELSTAGRVTSLSGRGVGLEAAKRAVERVGGAITVTTSPGAGTEFRLRLPLLVAIRRVLLVACRGEWFALPLASLVETFRLPWEALHHIERRTVTRWRGRLLTVESLAARMGVPAQPPQRPQVPLCLVLRDEHDLRGVLVDELIGQHDVMVKELEPVFGDPSGVAGAAILGDGRVVMVLDPKTLTRRSPAPAVFTAPPRGAAPE